MSWHYASNYKIEKIIESLKIKNTGGYDEISTRKLKLSALYFISLLTYICNAILNITTNSILVNEQYGFGTWYST